jgi:hypothetical protein
MTTLIKTCRSTALAAAFAVAFGATPALLAQTQSGNAADTATTSSGASGTSATSGASGQEGKQQASSAKGKSDQSAKSGSAKAPVYLLVPIEIATNDNAMKNGCWAKLYSRENYAGDMLTLVGPSTLADMDNAGFFGLNWDDRVDSLELGPKATMTVYDNENFRDQVAQFKPGQRIADVSKRVGLFDEFASLRVDCQQS